MDCSRGDDIFSYDADSFTSSAWRTPWTGIGDTCGDAERGRFSNLQDTEVTVTEGAVDCATAVDVFSSYLSSPKHPENSGNILSLDIDGWQCGSDIKMGGSNPETPCSAATRTTGPSSFRDGSLRFAILCNRTRALFLCCMYNRVQTLSAKKPPETPCTTTPSSTDDPHT